MKKIALVMIFCLLLAMPVFVHCEETKNVMVGEKVVITLPLPAEGSHWEVEQQPDIRLLLNGEPKITLARADRPGTETWTFEAPFSGKVNLIFKYIGPRANQGPPEKIVYVVIIREKSGRY